MVQTVSKMMKTAGENSWICLIRSAKRMLNATRSSIISPPVKMMIWLAGKAYTLDLTVRRETWIAWKSSFTFQTAPRKKTKFNATRNGWITLTVNMTMESAGKTTTKILGTEEDCSCTTKCLFWTITSKATTGWVSEKSWSTKENQWLKVMRWRDNSTGKDLKLCIDFAYNLNFWRNDCLRILQVKECKNE